MAVLGTESALRVQQEVKANAIPIVMATDTKRRGELVEQRVVRGPKRRESVIATDDLSGERLVCEAIPIRAYGHDVRILKR